jgi:hypothetical protein
VKYPNKPARGRFTEKPVMFGLGAAASPDDFLNYHHSMESAHLSPAAIMDHPRQLLKRVALLLGL